MFTTTDITGVTGYVSGKPLVPHDTTAEFKADDFNDSGMDAADTTVLDSLVNDPTVARYRWNGLTYDMRDDIVSTWKGVRSTVNTVGRQWRFNHGQFNPRIDEGLGWGDTAIAVIPAVAALATNEVDKGSIQAWGQLHHIFAVAGVPGPIDRNLMADLARTHGGSVNTVRFVHRLAALYWHAVTGRGTPTAAGQDNNQTVRLEIRRAATVNACNTVNALKGNIQDASGGKQFIPWNEPGAVDNQSVHKVLFAAAAGKLVAAGTGGSRFLKCWPDLGGAVEVLVDEPAQATGLRALHYVDLSAAEVWYAAVRWVGRYSDMAIWDEAIKFLGPFCASPGARQFTVLDSKTAYCLPRASMGKLCLGQLLEPNLDYSLGDAQRQPKHGLIIEQACVRGLLFSLLHWATSFKVVGWFHMYNMCNDGEAAEYWRRFARTTHVSGAWRVINANMSPWTPGSVGRIWGTVVGRRPESWRKLASLNNVAPQWDELVCRHKMVLPDAAIYGTVYPLRPTRETLPFKRWVGVGSLPAARGISHAFYSLLGARPQTVIRTVDPGTGSTTVPHRPLQNYRGSEADYSVFKGVDRNGFAFEPVFRFVDRAHYTRIIDPTSIDYERAWWIEAPESSPVMPRGLVDIPAPPPYGGGAPPPPVSDSESEDDGKDPDDVSDDGSSSEDFEIPVPGEEESKEDPTDPEGSAALQAICASAKQPDWRDLPKEVFQTSAKMGQLVKNFGQDDPLLRALARCIVNGAPAPGQAAPHFDVILNAEHYDRLQKVERSKRQMVCEDLEFVYAQVLRSVPPGSSSTQVARKAMGVRAIAAAMRISPALTIDELRETLSPKDLTDMGILKRAPGTRDPIHPGYVVNPDARLPEPALIKQALEGGYSMKDCLGVAARAATGASLPPVAPPQDSVADLCRVILDSALEAGAAPTKDMIEDIVGDAYTATSIFEGWEAARGILSAAEPSEEAKNSSDAGVGASPASQTAFNAPSTGGESSAGASAQSPTPSRGALKGSDVGLKKNAQAALRKIASRTFSTKQDSPRQHASRSSVVVPPPVDLGRSAAESQTAGTVGASIPATPLVTPPPILPSLAPPRASSSDNLEDAGAAEVVRATFVDPTVGDGGTQA